MALKRLLRDPQLLLYNLCLDPQVGKLVSQPLVLYPQRFSFLFAELDLLV
jgi:hypothetical protein